MSRVRLGNPFFHFAINAIFIIVIFVGLPGIIRWIADDDEKIRSFLPGDAMYILRNRKSKTVLATFRQFKSIDQANAFKGLIFTGHLIIGVFNIHAGDVVRQQHDFIAMQFFRVFVFERRRINFP